MSSQHNTIQSDVSRRQRDILKQYLELSLPVGGDMAECGVSHGGTAYALMLHAKRLNYDRTMHLFDMYGKVPDLRDSQEHETLKTVHHSIKDGNGVSLGEVQQALNSKAMSNYKCYKGLMQDTLPLFNTPLCFIHADANIYCTMLEIFKFARRLLAKGGYCIVHDYKNAICPGVERAVAEIVAAGGWGFSDRANTIQCALRKL